MATKKAIWVLFGILVISALVLGFAIQAGAVPIPLIPATRSDPWRPLIPIRGGHLGRSEATLGF